MKTMTDAGSDFYEGIIVQVKWNYLEASHWGRLANSM